MPFQATVREIDNGFLVETPLPGELHNRETFDASILEALASILLVHSQWSEKPQEVPLETPLRVPEKPSEGAVKFTKLCGLIMKPLGDFQEREKKYVTIPVTPKVRDALKTIVKRSRVLGGGPAYSSIIMEALKKSGV